jgi:MoaA/NifB/PqqE/SkfB family radical SAM enzyme
MKKIASMGFPLFVKWYITQRCNLRCTHCYLTDYSKSPPLQEVLPIVDYLGSKKVVSIVLIGGEPLARSDLVDIVRRISLNNIRTKIATNATLADLAKATALVEAGARTYQVSLEGATAEANDLVRGKGTFTQATAGIRALVAAGADVSIAFTLTGLNSREVGSMFELASRLSATGIKLNAFIPMGTGRLLARSHFLSPSTCNQIADDILACSARFPNLEVEAGAFVKKISMPTNRASSDSTFGCGAGTTSMIINSDLTLSACDMLVEEDRTSQPIGSPGRIGDLWQDDPLFRRWRGHKDVRRTPTIKSFDGVHQHGCHVAFNAYRANIFAGEQ